MSPEQVVEPVDYGHQMPEEPVPSAEVPAAAPVEETSGFQVRLDNFTGPFDLLLTLIGKHKLDVTEVALHTVTDDFIAYIRAMGDNWDLGEASEFLLVAATLLDLKAARLLPSAAVEDEEDLALLEARDLLFSRLLQYKAFKEAAAYIADLEGTGARRWPRDVSMERQYAEALPDLVLGIGVERLFKLALKQFTPKPGPPQVSIAHIHQARVSVREHAQLLRDRLRRAGSATFTLLVADCENTLEVVARFLALLELYREGLIEFEQPVSLDELTVRWVGGEAADGELEIDIDDYEGSKPDPDEAPPAEEFADDDLSEPLAASDGRADEEASGGGVTGSFAVSHDLADEDAEDQPSDPFTISGDVVEGAFGEPIAVSGDVVEGAFGEPLAVSGDVVDEALDEPLAVSGDLVDMAFGERDGLGGDEFDDGDSSAGGEGTFGAIVSDSGEDRAGRFDTPVARLDLGGGDDDAAAAAVEERS